MRYITILFLVVICHCVAAQDIVFSGLQSNSSSLVTGSTFASKPDLTFLATLSDAKVYSVSTPNTFFNKSYLVGKNGEVFSNSFMATSNFTPNDNLIVFSGQNTRQRDSFNPYGAYDMTSMIVLSTFNTFISKIKASVPE